jgi:glycosyltransferase involved in cell wall biosynthesis
MIEKYKISVITPSLNSARFLEQAIQSVLAQNYSNFEHIIVDGGSTDDTLNILKKYNHLTWVSEKDNGQSDAMNKGFLMSSGDIIVYLNSDDYFLDNAFTSVIPLFGSGSKFVVGNVTVLEETGKTWQNVPKTEFIDMLRWWEPDSFCYNPVGYFYLREVQQEIHFNLDNHFAMDVEFLLQSSLKNKFTKIDQTLGVYRYFPGTKTFSANDYKSLLRNQKYLDKFFDYVDLEHRRIISRDFNNYIKKLRFRDNIFYRVLDKFKVLFK